MVPGFWASLIGMPMTTYRPSSLASSATLLVEGPGTVSASLYCIFSSSGFSASSS